MRLIFVYDTETTGLPEWGLPSEDPRQPRVTQLCAELVEEDSQEVVAALHTIIKPDGWVIPPELEKLTGITNDRAMNLGQPMHTILPVFMDMWETAHLRVAHNESFDMRMMRIELMRHSLFKALERSSDKKPFSDIWKDGPAFCTLNSSKAIVNLPPTPKMIAAGRTGPKPPNLTEAYHHFTGQPLVNAHNATADVMACKAIYFALRRLETAAA